MWNWIAISIHDLCPCASYWAAIGIIHRRPHFNCIEWCFTDWRQCFMRSFVLSAATAIKCFIDILCRGDDILRFHANLFSQFFQRISLDNPALFDFLDTVGTPLCEHCTQVFQTGIVIKDHVGRNRMLHD